MTSWIKRPQGLLLCRPRKAFRSQGHPDDNLCEDTSLRDRCHSAGEESGQTWAVETLGLEDQARAQVCLKVSTEPGVFPSSVRLIGNVSCTHQKNLEEEQIPMWLISQCCQWSCVAVLSPNYCHSSPKPSAQTLSWHLEATSGWGGADLGVPGDLRCSSRLSPAVGA